MTIILGIDPGTNITGFGIIEISKDESHSDCKIITTTKIMKSLIEGTSKPQAAFMSGELKVTGDMKFALQVFSILF